MRKTRLFVYGTLKDPEALSRLLGDRDRWRAVGTGAVRAVLFDLGDYPGLVESAAPDDLVQGQVIELTEPDVGLARLDSYEGVHDGLYVRRELPVRLESGRNVTAWAYIYNRPVAGRRRIDNWPPR
jgi:gamma-glutamylcyclotransferase (GGCT)/AIG2-like uncharacterized protein YtfP